MDFLCLFGHATVFDDTGQGTAVRRQGPAPLGRSKRGGSVTKNHGKGSEVPRPKDTLQINDLVGLGSSGRTAQALRDYVKKNVVPKFQKAVGANNLKRGAGGKDWANPFGRFAEADALLRAHGTAETNAVADLQAVADEFYELGTALLKVQADYAQTEGANTKKLSDLHLSDAQRKDIQAILNPPDTTGKS